MISLKKDFGPAQQPWFQVTATRVRNFTKKKPQNLKQYQSRDEIQAFEKKEPPQEHHKNLQIVLVATWMHHDTVTV